MRRNQKKNLFVVTSNMRFGRFVLRPVLFCNSKSRTLSSFSHSILFTAKKDPVTSVTYILEKSNPIEPVLDKFQHIITPQIVSSVLLRPPSPQLGFRFFIWALKTESLRAWMFQDLIIDLMSEEGGFDLYWETLEELKNCGTPIPSDAFIVLISGYFEAGNAEKSTESFGKMKDFGCKPNVFTYNAILHVMVQKEVFLLALAVYNQMLKLNCSPNVATYTILIGGLCKSGKVNEALVLLDEMTSRGISPNNVTYTILMSQLCAVNKTHDALILFRKILRSGFCLDMITYNALLSGFCKFGKIDEAFMLLRSLENEGYAIKLNGYSCLIDGLFRARRIEEAETWFHKLCEENIVPDLILYTIMIRGFCEAGKVHKALQLLQEMDERRVVPDTRCYNTLIKGFCEAGKVHKALQLLQEMDERRVVPDTRCYNTLIKGFCDAGLLDNAKSLKLDISKNDCFPDTYTYTILICGMCRDGLVGEAKQIFEQMEKLGCSPSVVTFNALIDGLCKVGALDEARLLFYKMEIGKNPSVFLRLSQGADKVLDSASLQEMIERLCESGSYVKAYRFLRKLVDNGGTPNVTTYNILINGMCKAGNINAAFKLSKEMQLKGCRPDSVTYGTLIDGLYRVNRDDNALDLLEQMKKNGCLPTSSVYSIIMTWSCRKGKFSTAFHLWLQYLKGQKNRDHDAIKVVEEYFQEGNLAKAVQALLDLDFKMKDFELSPYTIWLIGLCQAHQVQEALAIFRVLEKSDVNVTPPSCVMLINGLCHEGDLDLAIDIFLYTLGKGFMLMPRICNLLLTSVLRSEMHKKQALDLLRRMKSLGYDLHSYIDRTTKSLIIRHLNAEESIMESQEDVRLASPG